MATVFRHDPIELHPGVQAEDFERFMREELLPHFSAKYARLTRTTYAVLTRQSLLKDTDDQHTYLWVSEWDEGGERVRGAPFEAALVRDPRRGETDAMLRRLDAFGGACPERVFTEV